jgi:hypothetical protein
VVSELIANLNLVAKDAHELMNAKDPDSAEKMLADAYKASVSRDETAAAVEELNNLMAVFLPELAQFCVDSSQGGSNRSD